MTSRTRSGLINVTSAIRAGSIPCADSGIIWARRQVTKPELRRTIRTSAAPRRHRCHVLEHAPAPDSLKRQPHPQWDPTRSVDHNGANLAGSGTRGRVWPWVNSRSGIPDVAAAWTRSNSLLMPPARSTSRSRCCRPRRPFRRRSRSASVSGSPRGPDPFAGEPHVLVQQPRQAGAFGQREQRTRPACDPRLSSSNTALSGRQALRPLHHLPHGHGLNRLPTVSVIAG
jgi:hypothetical protein